MLDQQSAMKMPPAEGFAMTHKTCQYYYLNYLCCSS